MVGAEERRVPGGLRGAGDRQLVGVGGALLGFDEDPEIHERQRRRLGQKTSTPEVLTNMPWPVPSLVNRVPSLSAAIVQPSAR